MEHQTIRKLILQCSDELDSSIVNGLLQQMPDVETLGAFKECLILIFSWLFFLFFLSRTQGINTIRFV